MLLIVPFCLRLLPLRKIEGFFMPAFLRSKKCAAWAGRIANRKQHLMQIIQTLHRKGRRAALLLLAPLALGLAWAEPMPTPQPATDAKPAKSAGKKPVVTKLPTIVVTAATRNPQSIDTTATTKIGRAHV